MKRFRKLSPKLIRRLTGLTVLLGICAMLLPLPMAPLPSNSPEKDLSQPFPCQNRPCGCRSAEQCWKKCCCFNNTQKIAWAKAHKVTIPAYVVVAAGNEKLTSSEVCSLPVKTLPAANLIGPQRGCSRCKASSGIEKSFACADPCATRDVAQTIENVLCGSKRDTNTATATKTAPPKASSSKWVMAVSSAACQGQGPHFYCSIVLVIPDSQMLTTATPTLIEVISLESERMLSASLRPPLPPPKIDEYSAAA